MRTRPLALLHPHLDARPRLAAAPEDTLDCLLKIARLGLRDVDERLRIAVGQWEPTALDLHHDPMSGTERMAYIRHDEIDRVGLARRKRFGLRKAPAILAAEGLPAHQLLVSAHMNVRRIWIGIRIVTRVYVDQFHHKV